MFLCSSFFHPMASSILPPASWLCPQCKTSYKICGAQWKQKCKAPNKVKNFKLVIAEAFKSNAGSIWQVHQDMVWLRGLLAQEAGPASRFWALLLLHPWGERVGSSHVSQSLRPTQVGDNSLILATSPPVTRLNYYARLCLQQKNHVLTRVERGRK